MQVLRDLKALSRPHIFDIGSPLMRGSDYFVLKPGWAGHDGMHIEVFMTYEGALASDWLAVTCGLRLDGNPIRGQMPGVLFTGQSDTPSGLIQIAPVADSDSGLGGWHTITLRTVQP